MKKPKCSQCGEKVEQLFDSYGDETSDADDGMCKPCARGEMEMRIEDLKSDIETLEKRMERLE